MLLTECEKMQKQNMHTIAKVKCSMECKCVVTIRKRIDSTWQHGLHTHWKISGSALCAWVELSIYRKAALYASIQRSQYSDEVLVCHGFKQVTIRNLDWK